MSAGWVVKAGREARERGFVNSEADGGERGVSKRCVELRGRVSVKIEQRGQRRRGSARASRTRAQHAGRRDIHQHQSQVDRPRCEPSAPRGTSRCRACGVKSFRRCLRQLSKQTSARAREEGRAAGGSLPRIAPNQSRMIGVDGPRHCSNIRGLDDANAKYSEGPSCREFSGNPGSEAHGCVQACPLETGDEPADAADATKCAAALAEEERQAR